MPIIGRKFLSHRFKNNYSINENITHNIFRISKIVGTNKKKKSINYYKEKGSSQWMVIIAHLSNLSN